MFSLFFLLLFVFLLSYLFNVVLDLLLWPEGGQFQRLPLGLLTLIALIPQAHGFTVVVVVVRRSKFQYVSPNFTFENKKNDYWVDHRTSGLSLSWILARAFPQHTTEEVFRYWATALCQWLYVSHILLRMGSSLPLGKCELVLKPYHPYHLCGLGPLRNRHSDENRYARGFGGKHMWSLKREDTHTGRAFWSSCSPNTCARRGKRIGKKSPTLQHSSEKVSSKLPESFPGKIVREILCWAWMARL